MDIQQIRETDIWGLYQKGRNFHWQMGIYTDTDRNWRFYNGDQWGGAKLGGVEPVQKNFIQPIVKYKVAVIHDNLYAMVFKAQNVEDRAQQQLGTQICRMLNRYAARVWEKDHMDYKGRRITKAAAVNDEGILYVDFDKKTMMPVNEILDKNDVYYGDENNDDIQTQPYILIRKRMSVVEARELAIRFGLEESELGLILGDRDTFEQAGEAAKQEVDDRVTVLYKLYKEDGTVRFSAATRFCQLAENIDLVIPVYPLEHLIWEEKKGSARGEGEVRSLIPNQIEVNRTEMRRVLTVKDQAYPQKVAAIDLIENPDALSRVGSTIYVTGKTVEDVRKAVFSLPPAQMSQDVKLLQDDLIKVSRDLKGAGDTATGQVNPENASGKAILAVEQAQRAPMTEQKEGYKYFLEGVGRIWLEYLIAHSGNGVPLEMAVPDPESGEEIVKIVKVSQSLLKKLRASVAIDITPKSVFDRFAQEQTIEILLTKGLLTPAKVAELEVYERLLDDDAVAPKLKIREAIQYIKGQQRKIAQIDAKAKMMMQRAQNFLNEDPEAQAQQMADAAMQMNAAPVAAGQIA